jgi:PLP dependent protein
VSRQEELAANLAAVKQRIASACTEVGRSPDEVTLVVVTKFFPASDVRLLAGLGVTDVGENRHQEAEAKVAECADLSVRWHFIGGLQSNKAAAVAAYSNVVESVDRPKVVAGLDRGAHGRADPLDCLVQVSLDPPEQHAGRSGVLPESVSSLADELARAGMLRLRGLMAVAPPDEDPRSAFERLAGIRERLLLDHSDSTWLSAGMSGDLEAAISHGATHVRVGSAVLGSRPRFK